MFCSIEKGDYLLSFRENIEVDYQLDEQEKITIPVEILLHFGFFIKQDSIQFTYLLLDMATKGINPLVDKWRSNDFHNLKLIFSDQSNIQLSTTLPTCIFELAPLNKMLGKILVKQVISPNEIHQLSVKELEIITVVTENETIVDIEIPRNTAKQFQQDMQDLWSRVQLGDIQVAPIVRN